MGNRRGEETKPLLTWASAQVGADNTQGNKSTIIQEGQCHTSTKRADHTGPGCSLSQEHLEAAAAFQQKREMTQEMFLNDQLANFAVQQIL